MNRLVWYPALISIALLGLAVYFSTVLKLEEGLPLTYLYVGATLPVALLLLRSTGLFLQRRTGDKHPCRLCGADAHLGRGNSGRKEDRSGRAMTQ